MDPLTQGLLGGCVAQAGLGRRADLPLSAAGLFGALAPDLDVLIHSGQNPVLSWEMHRHFTHALLFIPIGGLVISLVLWIFYRHHYAFRWIFLATTLGYATHGLLDAFTSYGTLLFWPFSQVRIHWDILSVLDPIVTFILLLGFLGSLWRRSRGPAVLALLGVVLYTGMAHYQHQRGLEAQKDLALSRGHVLERGRVMPTLGSAILWRSVYESSGRLYVDTIRQLPWGEPTYWEEGSVEKFQKELLPNEIPSDSRLAFELDRVRWFSDDFLIWMDKDMGVIGDFRYGQGVKPYWGIRVYFESPEKGVSKVRFRYSLQEILGELFDKKLGKHPGAGPIPQVNAPPSGGPPPPNHE